MKTYASAFTSDIANTRAEDMGWVVRLSYNNGSILRFGSKDLNITLATDTIGAVINIEGMESGIDVTDSGWNSPRVSVELSDGFVGGETASSLTDKSLSGVMVGKNFVGRAISIWRVTKSMTTLLSHDKEFSGYISEVNYNVESNSYIILADSWHAEKSKAIPQTIINDTDYPDAPLDSIGKVIPIVYGSFLHLLDGSDEVDKCLNNWHLVPSVCINESTGVFAFASHACNALTNTDVAIFDSSLQSYLIGLYGDTGAKTRPTISTSGPTTATLPSASGLKYLGVDACYLKPTLIGGKDSGQASNRHRAIDLDTSSYLSLTTSGTNVTVLFRFGGVNSFASPEPVTAAASVQIYHRGVGENYKSYVYNGVLSLGEASSSEYDDLSTSWRYFEIGNFTQRSDNAGNTPSAATVTWTWEEVGLYEYGLIFPYTSTYHAINVLGIMLTDLVLGNIDDLRRDPIGGPSTRQGRRARPRKRNIDYDEIIAKHYNIDYGPWEWNTQSHDLTRERVFAELEGREFGSWVDSVGRSNSYNSGDLITKSCYQIESILRDELGFSDSDIDVSDFDDVSTVSYDTKFSLHKQNDAYNIIQELSFYSHAITFPDSSGTWQHIRIPDDPDGDAISAMDIDWKDIRPLSVDKTSLELLCNDLTVSYSLDYGSGKYLAEYNVSDATSQGNTVDGYSHTFPKRMSCPYLRYSSAGGTDYAESFADFYLANWKDQHNVFEFEMLNFAGFGLEEGDRVTFNNFERNLGGIGAGSAGDYWASFSSPRTPYWLIVNRRPYLDKVIFTAFQLHKLT